MAPGTAVLCDYAVAWLLVSRNTPIQALMSEAGGFAEKSSAVHCGVLVLTEIIVINLRAFPLP
jgi:hypothetical protein